MKINHFSKAFVFFGITMLVGCAPKVWVKPNGDNSTFERDKYSCMQSSQQQVSGVKTVPAPNGWAQVPYSEVQVNYQMYDACMGAKGWRLQGR